MIGKSNNAAAIENTIAIIVLNRLKNHEIHPIGTLIASNSQLLIGKSIVLISRTMLLVSRDSLSKPESSEVKLLPLIQILSDFRCSEVDY